MPVCTVYLFSLQPNTGISQFLDVVSKQSPAKPLVISRVIRWIILPTTIQASELLTHQWDLLLVLPGTASAASLPPAILNHVHATWAVQAGVPSSLTKDFDSNNSRLLHPRDGDVPALTGSLDKPRVARDSQDLEMSEELQNWIKAWDPKGARGAVSMLNLLTFKQGMHSEYLKYGKAFAESIGKKRGGTAKIVGKVTGGAKDGEKSEWDEIALAHYPSIWHFADMVSSQDYQDINHKHRVGSLKDTCILCTSELELPGDSTKKSKL